MKKKTKVILWSIVLAVILIGGMIEGGKYYMDRKEEQQHEEMVAYVKKYRGVIEDDLKRSDKNNFIKSITIDYDKVQHNPMEGIDVEGYVNDNKTLDFDGGIDKETIEGKEKVVSTGIGISPKLDKYLGDD
ncbi:DUF1310 family protein [Ligilactobacillus acidipiscis]|uniref:DUF1310 family protein n=1 Tax=Ligilactobacillus acidipiscis TaxID=89059 RepID=UPI0023F9C637|nr:DUF1310 family protein [Ligilactobacillus acidipiscis]WEV56440.1 DUF1310 family protein [Ligilactobacillus acidipiscis]